MPDARPFERAIRTALERPVGFLRAAELEALFGGRAAYGAIQGWRYGRRNAPQWAIELLRHKALARARQAAENALALRAGKGRAFQSAELLRAYNARRAAQKAKGEAT